MDWLEAFRIVTRAEYLAAECRKSGRHSLADMFDVIARVAEARIEQ